jgi:hypothetical protein
MRRSIAIVAAIFCLAFLTATPGVNASPAMVQADTPIATVTGTPEGPQIIVPDKVNVRLCPDVNCDLVGVLIAGQQASAIGRSPGGDWIQIVYPGVSGDVAWVYSHYVVLPAGQSLLPIVEPPSTPTSRITSTIDPTLAAQFNLGESMVTRLPTYTPAAPVIQPTFESANNTNDVGFPPILAILGLLVLGLFGIVISILRGSSSSL